MASPLGGPSSHIPGNDARDIDDASEVERPSTTHEELDNTGRLCPWRTLQFHDQECYRYFDCPSHHIERRLSMDDTTPPDALRAGLPAEDEIEEEVDISARGSIDEASMTDEEHSIPDRSPVQRSPTHELPATPDAEPSRSSPRLSITAEPDDTSEPSRFDSAAPPIRTSSLPIRTRDPSRNIDIRPTDHTRHRWSEPSDHGDGGIVASVANAELSGSTSQDTSRQIERPAVRPRLGMGVVASGSSSPQSTARPLESDASESTEIVLPRWQPDAEVTYCPICQTQFSIFVRKHHCRKCGRVVCNSCSPHRIIIPHQFIVRPPGSEVPLPQSLLLDGLSAGFIDMNGLSGGERVRLCNPCVPDPNIAPPQSPTASSPLSPQSARHRSRSSLGGGYPAASPAYRYGGVFTTGQSNDSYQFYNARTRSTTLDPSGQRVGSTSSSRRRSSAAFEASMNGLLAVGPSSLSSPGLHPSGRRRFAGESASSSRQRALPPPPPQIAEEDECPICHQELPSRDLENFDRLREEHITDCIQAHSTYGSPRSGSDATATPSAPPRRTGMYTYPATEKDCVDDAECTICLEEFTVGVAMARLECLCRFHRACIAAWFVNHPGRCPVHQHDGFGY